MFPSSSESSSLIANDAHHFVDSKLAVIMIEAFTTTGNIEGTSNIEGTGNIEGTIT